MRPRTDYDLLISHLGDDTPWAQKRFGDEALPSVFDWRDVGLAEATRGEYSFQVVRAKDGPVRSTGWHYHTCSLEVIYCIRGWEEIAFEDGSKTRLEAGTCVSIPPGFGHNQLNYSDDIEVILLYSPAVVGTTNIPVPEPWRTRDEASRGIAS